MVGDDKGEKRDEWRMSSRRGIVLVEDPAKAGK
jgi:hypothetical protein